ncbi:MAG: hypothetical protein PWQ61_3370 [Betaproteobacteria bacterium]|nr:hypothetical protein [Betaproteobacteria bacterium]
MMLRALGIVMVALAVLPGCDSAADREAAAKAQRLKEYKERKKADFEHDKKLLDSLGKTGS